MTIVDFGDIYHYRSHLKNRKMVRGQGLIKNEPQNIEQGISNIEVKNT